MRKILPILVILFTLFALTGCNKKSESNVLLDMINNENPDKQVLFLAESQGIDYPTAKGALEFARLVKERTNGRIEIQVIPKGGLGSEKDTIAQAQIGAIDFTRVSLAPLTKYSPTMNILSLPYIYRDETHVWNVLNGPIGTDALKSLEENNLTGLCFYDSGTRSFYNNKKEIKSLADLKGLRIRIQENELMKLLVSSLGAQAIPMDPAAVLESLALGVIDGAENNTATYVMSNQFNVAKYYTYDEHSRIPDVLVASSLTMGKLSKEDQDIIKQAALDSVELQRKEWKANEAEMLKSMEAAGCKITQLDASAKQEFIDAVTPVYEEFGAGYEELIKKIQKTK